MNPTPAEQAAVAASDRGHRDVTAEFYRAVPPRAVPWRKRLFWRAVLALAATPVATLILRRR